MRVTSLVLLILTQSVLGGNATPNSISPPSQGQQKVPAQNVPLQKNSYGNSGGSNIDRMISDTPHTDRTQKAPPAKGFRWYFEKETGQGFAIPITKPNESPSAVYGSYPAVSTGNQLSVPMTQTSKAFFDPITESWTCPMYEQAPRKSGSAASLEKKELSTNMRIPKQLISLSNAMELDRISDSTKYNEAFFNITGIKKNFKVAKASIMSGFGRSSGITGPIAEHARCMPELKTVQLDLLSNDTTYYHPGCVRIERCGGCCSHESLSCQATKTEMVQMTVVRVDMVGQNMEVGGKETISVEKHKGCQCACIVKAKDCNSAQEYLAHECRCSCKNTNRERECHSQPLRFWDPTTCKCMCSYVYECSTGMVYNQRRCRCERIKNYSTLGKRSLRRRNRRSKRRRTKN